MSSSHRRSTNDLDPYAPANQYYGESNARIRKHNKTRTYSTVRSGLSNGINVPGLSPLTNSYPDYRGRQPQAAGIGQEPIQEIEPW